MYLWCGWNFVTDGRTDERTNGQGESRSWIRDVMLLLMMVKVIRMFMWQVIRHDNLCNVGQNWLSEYNSTGCSNVDFDGRRENILDLIQARLGCRPLWSWVSSSWWGFQTNICNSMQIPGLWERNMGQTVFHVWTGFRKRWIDNKTHRWWPSSSAALGFAFGDSSGRGGSPRNRCRWQDLKSWRKHCQRHNGPVGWVLLTKVTSLGHITSSFTNLEQTSLEYRPSTNFKIPAKHHHFDKT